MSQYLFGPLPDPSDTSGTPRKPYLKQEGIYVLAREAGDTEVAMLEPNGDTYILEFFEAEVFLKTILKVKEMYRQRILDYLWNFFRVAFDPDVEHAVILRGVDQEGWEDEIKLHFKENRDDSFPGQENKDGKEVVQSGGGETGPLPFLQRLLGVTGR